MVLGQLVVRYPPKNRYQEFFDALEPWDPSWTDQHDVILRRAFPDYDSARSKLQRARRKVTDTLSSTTDVDQTEDKRKRRDRAARTSLNQSSIAATSSSTSKR